MTELRLGLAIILSLICVLCTVTLYFVPDPAVLGLGLGLAGLTMWVTPS